MPCGTKLKGKYKINGGIKKKAKKRYKKTSKNFHKLEKGLKGKGLKKVKL